MRSRSDQLEDECSVAVRTAVRLRELSGDGAIAKLKRGISGERRQERAARRKGRRREGSAEFKLWRSSALTALLLFAHLWLTAHLDVCIAMRSHCADFEALPESVARAHGRRERGVELAEVLYISLQGAPTSFRGVLSSVGSQHQPAQPCPRKGRVSSVASERSLLSLVLHTCSNLVLQSRAPPARARLARKRFRLQLEVMATPSPPRSPRLLR